MEHLIAGIKNSEYKAFLELYNLIHKKVYHFFAKRLRVTEEAEELTQDSFVKLWRYRHSLSPDHPLEKQLFIICYGLLINHLKKESTIRRQHGVFLRTIGSASETAEDLQVYESVDEIHAAISTLPPVSKRVMTMKLINGYSNQQIADALSVSPKTVEGHVTKALKLLRNVVGELVFLVLSSLC